MYAAKCLDVAVGSLDISAENLKILMLHHLAESLDVSNDLSIDNLPRLASYCLLCLNGWFGQQKDLVTSAEGTL